MSVRQNVNTPVGSDAPPGAQPLDQLAGRVGPPGGVGGEPDADRRLELRPQLRVDALPRRVGCPSAARR